MVNMVERRRRTRAELVGYFRGVTQALGLLRVVRAATAAVLNAARVAWLVVFTLVQTLGGAAQVAGVGIGTWAAWDYDALAGRIVLAVGLLFLGGALRRVATEVRDGSTR